MLSTLTWRFSHLLCRNARCLFVLSTGRTGTSLLTTLLDQAPEIQAYHERRPRLAKQTHAAFYDVHERPTHYNQTFLKAHGAQIALAHLTGRTYVDTSNRLTYFAPALSTCLRNSKFLHIFRHPGDVVRSGMRRGWYASHPSDRYRITPSQSDPAYSEWPEWNQFQKICWYWAAVNRFAIRFVESMPAERIMQVRFEDLINPATGIAKQLFTFLDAPAPEDSQISLLLKTPKNKQSQGHFPTYNNWSESQKSQLHEIASDVMERLGYLHEDTTAAPLHQPPT